MNFKKIFKILVYIMTVLVVLEVICFVGIYFLPYGNGTHDYMTGEFSLIAAFILLIPMSIVGILMLLLWTWQMIKGIKQDQKLK